MSVKITDVEFIGQSGIHYSFEVYPRGTQFNHVAAVYLVTKRTIQNGRGVHEIIYVGETADLAERFSNHHKEDCFNMSGANCICVHLEKDAGARLRKEADLVEAHKPPCNG